MNSPKFIWSIYIYFFDSYSFLNAKADIGIALGSMFLGQGQEEKKKGRTTMKKQLTKAIAVVLAGVMVLGLAACGAQKEQEESSKTPAPSSKVEESNQEESKEEFVISYPIDTDKTFSYFACDGGWFSSSLSSFDESPYHQKLAELTGVDVQFDRQPADANGWVALDLLLAEEEDRPDVFNRGWFDTSVVSNWIADDVIIDLTDYLPTYAPDFWELINTPEMASTKAVITDEEGRFYYIPFLSQSRYNLTYIGPAIRQDWLDECGLKTPVTMDDLENVLVTFKEKYGATFGCVPGRFNAAGLASGTGAMASLKANLYVDDNGKIQCANVQPEWKEFLTYMNKWMDMGLIDPDFFNMDANMLRQKAVEGKIGVAVVSQSELSNIVNDAVAAENGADWVGIEYLRTAPGEPTSWIQTQASQYSSTPATFITTACDEDLIPLVLAWVNYAYTEEGMMFTNFGVEGETYTKDADGNIQWTDLINNDPLGASAAREKYTAAQCQLPTVLMESCVRLRNVEVAQVAVDKWINNTVANDRMLPGLVRTEDENVVYTDKWTALSTYIEENAIYFMSGERSLDEFDAFVAELEKMGLQDVIDVQQAAYNRFISK